MKYIYDIVLNFNEEFFEFYDWNLNDEITHIKKIPIIKIDSLKINEIKNNDIEFDNEFLNKIENKTETFKKKIKYAFLITDDTEVIALKITDKIKYSSLQITEELDILEDLNLNYYDLKYNLKKKKNNYLLKTRLQYEIKNKVIDFITNLENDTDIEKLRYIYYECFNRKELEKKVILENIKKQLKNKEIYLKLMDFCKQIN